MKTFHLRIVASLLLLASFACKDVIYENDLRNVPIYLSYEQLRESIVKTSPLDLENPGKIYFKDGYIFINEELKGIHVIDNRNPKSPLNIGFIEIPGNMDLAIKNDILYADSYIDLVAVNIADVNNPVEVSRVKDVFPYTVPVLKDGKYLMAEIEKSKGVVVDWKIDYSKLRIEQKYYPVYQGGWYESQYYTLDAKTGLLASNYSGGYGGGQAAQASSFGVGGSMARFGLNGKYLYTVDKEAFHIFNVDNAKKPILESEMEAGIDIETMFIHDGHMFLGTMNGMLVYSLANPNNPVKINSYSHVRSCDPVVVQNHIAYVTLRGGNECGRTVSKLDILSLSNDYNNSTLMYSYTMKEPYGLGIEGDILFVCDGKDGLMVYEASNPATITQKKIAQFPAIDAFDVIPYNGYLFMIGKDGFYQYDYSNLQNIHQVSLIPVLK